MNHGDRKGRHYYMTAPQGVVRKYSSGDPCGRHAWMLVFPILHSPDSDSHQHYQGRTNVV